MITFRINDEQIQKLDTWRKGHSCPYRTPDGRYDISSRLSSVGGLEEFRFVPTSIGVIVTTCHCACGAKVELTDYSRF